MTTQTRWDKSLSHREVQLCCLAAIGLHLLPLLLADHFYIDDSWRSQLAGTGWIAEGRGLIDLLYAALTFSPGAPNIFPLPLLLGAGCAALALARLVRHYFTQPGGAEVLVVLPLWFNPFFLQNLSYQYDGPAMALCLAAVVWAITLEPSGWRRILGAALLVAVGLSLYQVSLNLFAGLCCIDVLRQVLGGSRFPAVLRYTLARLAQLLAGCAIYLCTAFPFMSPLRKDLLPLDGHWAATLLERLERIAGHLGLLFTDGNRWLALALLLLALLALLLAAAQVLRSDQGWPARLGLLLGLLLPLPLLALLISGLVLLFADFNDGARTLLGWGSVLLLVFFLARRLLVGLHPRLAWLLAIPLLCMLSFAYAYGRVLVLQKELQQAVSFALSRDIAAQPTLWPVQRFYVLNIGSSGGWLPAASGSTQLLPALKYVLNTDFLLLPEMMPRVGISTFGSSVPYSLAQVLARSPQPLVDSKFYAIYLADGMGFVLMKAPSDPEPFRW